MKESPSTRNERIHAADSLALPSTHLFMDSFALKVLITYHALWLWQYIPKPDAYAIRAFLFSGRVARQ